MRHHINDVEFTDWYDDLEGWVTAENSKEFLYDLWVDGYSQWEVEAICE